MKLVGLLFEEEGQITLLSTGQPGQNSLKAESRVSEPEQAVAVLREINSRAKQAGIKLEDLVVVFRDQYGKVHIKQTREVTAGKGARHGSFWGLLVGLLLGGPFAGLFAGMILGAVYGKKIDHGINDTFIRNIAGALQKGESAVLVLITPEDYEQSIGFLRSFDTRIVEAEITPETEAAVLKAAEDNSIQQAIKTEFDVE
jgi:uncharacterized membrane protein